MTNINLMLDVTFDVWLSLTGIPRFGAEVRSFMKIHIKGKDKMMPVEKAMQITESAMKDMEECTRDAMLKYFYKNDVDKIMEEIKMRLLIRSFDLDKDLDDLDSKVLRKL